MEPADDSSGRSAVVEELTIVATEAGLSPEVLNMLPTVVSTGSITLQHSDHLMVHNSTCSWHQHYPVLSFPVSGHLHSEYERLSGLLGFPSCSGAQWSRIVKRLEEYITNLAEWSCGQVRNEIIKRGDRNQWMASFDGFYLTRGHYSNNSATLHDYATGKVAWFTHQTKRGTGHNWSGTLAGSEPNMLDKLLGKAKRDGFFTSELICDKDSSTNATFCRHYFERMIMYCSNHSAKNLHKALEKVKQYKCEVSFHLI